MVYEVATKKTVEVDAFSEASGAKPDTEYYLYNVRWTPDGSELLVSRTPRRQDVLDVLAANPATGKTRIVVTEKQDTWQDNAPGMHFVPLAFEEGCNTPDHNATPEAQPNRFYAYGVVARLALLAASLELERTAPAEE